MPPQSLHLGQWPCSKRSVVLHIRAVGMKEAWDSIYLHWLMQQFHEYYNH